MNAEFIEALNAIEKERGISKDILIDAFESALIAAYKRNYGAVGNVRATVDRDTGEVQIFASKTVTETVQMAVQVGGKVKARHLTPARCPLLPRRRRSIPSMKWATFWRRR